MSFADLKKKAGSFEKLQEELEKVNNPVTSFADDRFWKPELDKSGNGFAVIRFLPQSKGEDLPWVKIWSHAFKGPGGWYIENSLTTLNRKDPVSEYNTELWNSGVEANKETARKQKRILKYYSNVLVESDPKHPENEGKIFLFRYGKKIFDKLTEAMSPQFEDEEAMNPFDFWTGASFKLKIRKVDGFWNYDKSEFATPTAIYGGDDTKLETLYGLLYSLTQFLGEDNFKAYDALKEKLNRVLTGSGFQGTVEKFTPKKTQSEVNERFPEVDPVTTTGDDEDDTLSYFAKLADDD
ncbi:MAG TPA: single-stranded DNA-binding protein [Nitrososphaerales archaeon]|nr:single-stranded DNA-binding protein [Nitrososphaerales archaeon]